MRQCPAVAWEGWTTRALCSAKISMGRRAFLDGPAAPLISGRMPAAPRNVGELFFTASALQRNSARAQPLIIEHGPRAAHLDQLVVGQPNCLGRILIDGMLQYGAGFVAAVL
jgi:hypothetical protein